MASNYAICTLLTNDAYLPGAIALVAALRDLHTRPAQAPEVDFQTVCIVTPETVDVSSIKLLRRTFDLVVGVEIIEQEDIRNLQLLGTCLSFSHHHKFLADCSERSTTSDSLQHLHTPPSTLITIKIILHLLTCPSS
jgi:hypothetical protein